MGFVSKRISEEDRKGFDLDQSGQSLSLVGLSREWPIDHGNDTFVRVLRLHGRKNEAGDVEDYAIGGPFGRLSTRAPSSGTQPVDAWPAGFAQDV